jgi:hypothetical protein
MTTRLGNHPELGTELSDSLEHLRMTLEKEPTLKKARPSLRVSVLQGQGSAGNPTLGGVVLSALTQMRKAMVGAESADFTTLNTQLS